MYAGRKSRKFHLDALPAHIPQPQNFTFCSLRLNPRPFAIMVKLPVRVEANESLAHWSFTCGEAAAERSTSEQVQAGSAYRSSNTARSDDRLHCLLGIEKHSKTDHNRASVLEQ
jgi:hypothetical protein